MGKLSPGKIVNLSSLRTITNRHYINWFNELKTKEAQGSFDLILHRDKIDQFMRRNGERLDVAVNGQSNIRRKYIQVEKHNENGKEYELFKTVKTSKV